MTETIGVNSKRPSGQSGLIEDDLKPVGLAQRIENIVSHPIDKHELNDPRTGSRGYVFAGGLLFEGRTYGRKNSKPSGELHRLYVQVEADDIPAAVEILCQRGRSMAERGLGLNFKFLVGKEDRKGRLKIGNFPDLADGDPRIVVYFDTAEERRIFFREIFYGYMEQVRSFSKKREGRARRPGSHTMYDPLTGKELRAFCYTLGGYSEEVLEKMAEEGKDWRLFARGTPTKGSDFFAGKKQ